MFQLRYTAEEGFGLWHIEEERYVAYGDDPTVVMAAYYAALQDLMLDMIEVIFDCVEDPEDVVISLIPRVLGVTSVEELEGPYIAPPPIYLS